MYSILTRHPATLSRQIRTLSRRNPPPEQLSFFFSTSPFSGAKSRKPRRSRAERLITEVNPGIEELSRENPHLNPQSHADLLRAEIRDFQPENPRTLTVGVLGNLNYVIFPCKKHLVVSLFFSGVPNAGKSTLVNSLCGIQSCPESPKVHTTRQTAASILTHKEKQVITGSTKLEPSSSSPNLSF